MSWPVAFVLGAIVSPPDAVAATAVIRRLKVPRRIVTILEGESLVNDATGLVAGKFAIAAVASGPFSLSHASALSSSPRGAWRWGSPWAFWLAQLHRRLDDFEIETAITLLTRTRRAYRPSTSVSPGCWRPWRPVAIWMAQSAAIFSALDPLPRAGRVERLAHASSTACLHFLHRARALGYSAVREHDAVGALLAQAAAVSGVTIGVRLVWVPVAAYLPRLLSSRLRKREPRPRWEAIFLIAWTGMRGIVSLALALAVPLTLPNGAPFPQREVVIVLSFAVILVTLLVPGLTLPWLIARLHLEDDGIDLREERDALIRASEAALARLRQIDDTVIVHPLLIERVRAPYEERLTRLTTEQHEDPECRLTEGEAQAFRRMRGQALEAERQAVVAMRNEGKLGEEVLVRVQEDLDLEALQPDR